MRRSGWRWQGVGQHGLRRATAIALAAVVVAGCEVATGAAAGHSSEPASNRPTASAAGTPAPSSPAPDLSSSPSPRIMIVGDSITKGSSGDYTWQYWLYEHLRADGISPHMVGPYDWLHNNVTNQEKDYSYADPHFEHANDAAWGMTLQHEKDVIGGKVAKYRPDYLLVLLGIDDIFWFGIGQSGMATDLADFIAAARAARPSIRIVLGLIPPNIHGQTNPVLAAAFAAFNQTILATASRLSTTASPIAVAHDGSGINVATDLWDGTHPNANGEIKIAAAFADALASRFHLGSPYPRPLPVLPTGPLTSPQLTLRSSGKPGQVVLSWTLAPGGTGYYVYLEDVTRGATTFTRLPWPLPPTQDPWVARLLTSGDTYAFKLRACKDVDCNAFSNVATIRAP